MALEIAVLTYCVLAICVLLTPATAVGAVGVPVKAALAKICATVLFSTLESPTCDFVTL